MHQWFRKGNARRFHRVDMPIRYFILPSSPLEDRDIYASGANYFPDIVNRRIEDTHRATLQSLDKLQDQKEVISEIVNNINGDIEFFGNALRMISSGIHPKKDPTYWMQIKGKLNGFETIYKIKESAPKTFLYFQMIEQKYLAFLNTLVTSINNSDKDNFYATAELPIGFKIDETIKLFNQGKFSKIPLLQTILHLAKLLECYVEVYRQIHDDNYLTHSPNSWNLKMCNISASGIAVVMPKLFEVYSKVDVHLYFESSDKHLRFDGNVVDIREVQQEHAERIAINFEFPNGNDQDFIQQEIQKEEVRECMSFTFFD